MLNEGNIETVLEITGAQRVPRTKRRELENRYSIARYGQYHINNYPVLSLEMLLNAPRSEKL